MCLQYFDKEVTVTGIFFEGYNWDFNVKEDTTPKNSTTCLFGSKRRATADQNKTI
jgi:hypothetical protein